ncbi:MAG TPA: nucleotidyltransferase [Methanoregulaceae archaeon]|jgi:hypothetical protein|nr:nucleotidyltransferase [Methanoregulaceae archaeon]
MEKGAIISHIRAILPSFSDLEVAYLYGSSLSREDFRDIDIALFVTDHLSYDEQVSLAEKVAVSIEEALSFGHECDVRILNHAPVWFQFEVISTGLLVYSRTDGERCDRETAALIAYLDMKYTFDLFDAEYLARA